MTLPIPHFLPLQTFEVGTIQPVQEGAPAGGEAGEPAGMNPMFLILLMVGVFWFVVFAPERKNRKRQEQMRSELSKGDKVMTTSGLFGTVVQNQEDIVVLQVDEGVRLKFSRSAIQDRIDPSSGGKGGDKGKGGKDAKAETPAETEQLAEKA